MRLRSALPLGSSAVIMVAWLSIRMWCAGDPRVWLISCTVGAWAPFAAAALVVWAREHGPREHSVLVAWLVRALGMHCLLAWMVGFSDWMAGPPSASPRWNADLGAPLAMLAFIPAFAVSYGTLRWLSGLAARVAVPVFRPAMPGEAAVQGRPFRGVEVVRETASSTRTPVAPYLLGLVAYGVALNSDALPWWLVPATGLPLAGLTLRNARALVPSVATLAGLALMLLLRAEIHGATSAVTLAVAWPWLAMVTVVFYLFALEALVRARPVAVPAAR